MAVASDKVRRARPLLGTFVEIEVAGAAKSKMDAAIDAAFEAIASVHRLMSFHEVDSDVSRLNREASSRAVNVHAWTFQVLESAIDLNRRSGGIFDITVAPILQNIGLLPSLDDNPPIANEALSFDAVELLPENTVRFGHPEVKIDLGGIAKGFAVDQAVDLLRGFGIPSGLVNAGGDLAAFGPDPETAHIRDPRDPRRVMCSIKVSNEALASTGRRFDLFQSATTTGSAIVDPRIRKLTSMVDGATVRAPSCMMADALTKVAMIASMSAVDLLEHYLASALLISKDGDVQITSDWHNAVYLAA